MPSARTDAGARPAWQPSTVVIYRGSSIDDGSRGGGSRIGAGTPGVPPLPSGWPGMAVAPGASPGGNAAADATAQPPRTVAPQ
ncbi:hypothetical protein BVI434_1600011 [Burkholderia vietnamiensis]|nr:hypothetical protein BVI434_1600011 [Burkholderia vietnamiensis]